MTGWVDWMPFAATSAIAASTLIGLSSWARHIGTRSTPASDTPANGSLALKLLPLIALQIACAWASIGTAGALFNVVPSWMLVGWLFVLLLNARPAQTLLICRWLGSIGVVACLAIYMAIMCV